MNNQSSIIKTIELNRDMYFIKDNLEYEVLMGSQAYGCATTESDIDIYGFCMPDIKYIYPERAGIILDFDNYQRFEQYQTNHQPYKDTRFDANIYNIVKYVRLVANGNPNMIDSLFVPDECILHIGTIGQILRDNRTLFISKKIYHTFIGYLHAQTKRLYNNENTIGNRKALVEKYGYDVKCAYHMVRLASECYQILSTGELILNKPMYSIMYKEIRQGNWALEKVLDYCKTFEAMCKENYDKNNNIPENIREKEIHDLLFNIITEYYN